MVRKIRQVRRKKMKQKRAPRRGALFFLYTGSIFVLCALKRTAARRAAISTLYSIISYLERLPNLNAIFRLLIQLVSRFHIERFVPRIHVHWSTDRTVLVRRVWIS